MTPEEWRRGKKYFDDWSENPNTSDADNLTIWFWEHDQEIIEALRPRCATCKGKGFVTKMYRPNEMDTFEITSGQCPDCKGEGLTYD